MARRACVAAHSRPVPRRVLTSAMRSCHPAKPYSRAITSCASRRVNGSSTFGTCARARATACASWAAVARASSFACFRSDSRDGRAGRDLDAGIATSFHDRLFPADARLKGRCMLHTIRTETGGSYSLAAGWWRPVSALPAVSTATASVSTPGMSASGTSDQCAVAGAPLAGRALVRVRWRTEPIGWWEWYEEHGRQARGSYTDAARGAERRGGEWYAHRRGWSGRVSGWARRHFDRAALPPRRFFRRRGRCAAPLGSGERARLHSRAALCPSRRLGTRWRADPCRHGHGASGTLRARGPPRWHLRRAGPRAQPRSKRARRGAHRHGVGWRERRRGAQARRRYGDRAERRHGGAAVHATCGDRRRRGPRAAAARDRSG